MTEYHPVLAVPRDELRGEIANQGARITELEAALLPLAEVPISVNYAGPTMDGITRKSVTTARKLLGIRYGLVTDEATIAETMSAWQRWIANARGGSQGRPADICMYYAGYLAGSMYRARQRTGSLDVEVSKPKVAEAAFAAAKAGLVHLVQVKMGPDNYRYYAIRSSAAAAAN